ncbi:MAG: HPr family phosphocarrier protein [Flaviflexus sp.]|uniref:HPr family phosphocarrier protein n=1 Tax=Flaviflexus sp. TaxID=1969482 RepID=UPI00352CCD57
MFEQTIHVTTPTGLHARPAGQVMELASAAPFDVEIGRLGEEPVDAESILSIMGLGVVQGETVTVRCQTDADNPLAVQLLQDLSAVLTSTES